jgi:hypothetical protein
MKLLLEDVRKNVDVLLDQLEVGREITVLREGDTIIIQQTAQPSSKGPLPDLSQFRHSLTVSGEPASQTVTNLRKDYRY